MRASRPSQMGKMELPVAWPAARTPAEVCPKEVNQKLCKLIGAIPNPYRECLSDKKKKSLHSVFDLTILQNLFVIQQQLEV